MLKCYLCMYKQRDIIPTNPIMLLIYMEDFKKYKTGIFVSRVTYFWAFADPNAR